MPKQTAVEWLIKELNQEIDYIPMNKWDIIADKIHQALAMEKEQIVDAWSAGKKNPFIAQHSECCENNGKQYYNETFKGGEK